MKRCPTCGKEVKWYQGFSETLDKSGRYCSFACFKGRSVSNLGKEFESKEQRLQFIFQNKEELIQENKSKQSSVIGLGLVLGFVLGLIFGIVASSWLLFFILLAAPPVIFYYLKEQTIKKMEQSVEEYKSKLLKMEKSIRTDILEKFDKRYFSVEQKLEHIEDLVNLINHKKKESLNRTDGQFIILTYIKEKNIELFEHGLKKIKIKDVKNLASVFLRLVPYANVEDENDADYLEAFGQFLEVMARKNINVDGEELKLEILKQYKENRAEEFESKLKRNQDHMLTVEEIQHVDGFEFEKFIGDLFKKAGYKVKETKKSGDQGADLIIELKGVSTAVQTKKYAGSVGNKAVQEVVASMKYYDCDKAMVITTGTFTKSAYELAGRNSVQLIDKKTLEKLFDEIL